MVFDIGERRHYRELPIGKVAKLAVLTFVSAGCVLAPASAAAMPTGPDAQAGLHVPDRPGDGSGGAGLLTALSRGDPVRKIEPRLLEHVTSSPEEEEVYVVVVAAEDLGLERYARFRHEFTWPAGEHVAVARVATGDVTKIAALPGVISVSWGDPDAGPDAPRFEVPPVPVAQDVATLRRRLAAAPDWAETEALLAAQSKRLAHVPLARLPTGAQPDGWYDVDQGHAAREAWDMGFTGEGVTVAVLDYAVDFAHQDLQGTWRVLPEDHPYAGWPQVFDPVATYLHTLDADRPEESLTTRSAYGGMIEVYQRSGVEDREVDGVVKPTACFRPLLALDSGEARALGPEQCDFVVPPSQSGEIRYGHHPDTTLLGLGADPGQGVVGEWAGVLLVDSQVAGVYDAVYVDLDADHDFTDEKPATQADPLTWRDVDGDAVADLAGGLLYFISDGENPFPGAWLWGIDEVAEPGTIVGLFGPWQPGESHGTLCASNVVSQGRLGVPDDLTLEFRDLPADGRPESVNLGLAPMAKMVSIGSVYYASRSMYDVSWRYAMFGHSPDRDDDQIQVASNSYGFSGTDNDGWDAASRAIDYYVREFSPSTSMLFSTGNGAPGYGTLAPPSPATGLGVAASTQMGSTGRDSITNTLQITFGDVIPFSNRGPGADGRTGPTIAADGAYAAGAVPINPVTVGGANGAYANGTWGGTSRAGPVANGGLALTYDAFLEREGRWPTWEEARAILMAGARYAGYDTFVAGAGVLDAADSARIASGEQGIYVSPSEWTAGDYRGERAEAFAKLLAPGDSDSSTMTVHGASGQDTQVTLSAGQLRRIGAYTETVETNLAAESPPSVVVDYLLPIDRELIPKETELMVVRGIFPMSDFDPDGNNAPDNMFTLGVLQHTDINGNGKIWDDRNGNGVVNHRALLDSYVTVAWDGGAAEHESIQSGIAPPLEPEGLEAELAWYGRGCDEDAREQDVRERIALIARGECYFSEKMLNAQNDGAIGVLMFTDNRPKIAMGGDSAGITIPGVMIEKRDGLALVELLQGGTEVTAGMFPREFIGKGIDGTGPVIYPETEIEQYEYMRVTQDSSYRNNYSASVHHPHERWADGLYVGLWHQSRNDEVPVTEIQLRFDFYSYQDWDWLTLTEESLTVPADDRAWFDATLSVPKDAPYGAYPGAIFIDYERGEGDQPVRGPGGYELLQQRVVVPVNVNVAARLGPDAPVRFGGEEAADFDAPYPNGLVRGAFNWNWRNESGDWRFFFFDSDRAAPGSYIVYRTTWDDENTGQADIDTRVYAPYQDSFSMPGEPEADVRWFGPYTLELLVRSPYLFQTGGIYRYHTSSGVHDDWLASGASDGLHEVMLHNVRFSGGQFEMPFETQVGTLEMGESPVTLFGDECRPAELRSQLSLPEFQVRGFGMSLPEVFLDQPISQDTGGPESAEFKHDILVESEAGRFAVTLEDRPQDDLDLFLMYDRDADGEFAYDDELYAESSTPSSIERIEVSGFAPAGRYQVWVSGYAVEGGEGTFDLEIVVVTGDTIQVNDVPSEIVGGEAATFQVCADTAALEGQDGPAHGVLAFGPGGAPTLMRVGVEWRRERPAIYLPVTVRVSELGDG